jgi:hypothetical protein
VRVRTDASLLAIQSLTKTDSPTLEAWRVYLG